MSDQDDVMKLVLVGPCDIGRRDVMAHLAGYAPMSIAWPVEPRPVPGMSINFDYACAWLEGGLALSLYGVPDQARDLPMLPRILQGAFGAVILLAGDRASWLLEAHAWLRALCRYDAGLPVVIGITRAEDHPDFALLPLRESLHARDCHVPAFGIDPHESEESRHLVRALLLGLR